MIFTHPPTSKSSSPLNNPLLSVPKAPITIYMIVIFMFHSFFQFPSKVQVLILISTFFQFSSVVNFASSLFLLFIIISCALLAVIRLFVRMSKSHRSLCVSFSWTNPWLCIYHLFEWSHLNFLCISQWITLPTLSFLVLFSFCAFAYYVTE